MCVCVCVLSTFSNIFSSETTRPIEANFHAEPPSDKGTKVNGSGHMTKIVAMPLYGQNLANRNQKADDIDGMKHWALKYYQVCSNDDPGLTLTYFMGRTNLVPYAFVLSSMISKLVDAVN